MIFHSRFGIYTEEHVPVAQDLSVAELRETGFGWKQIYFKIILPHYNVRDWYG